jgi:RNA polymerase sigma factor (TIGR02999 family)
MAENEPRTPDITRWLIAWTEGRQDALDQLTPLVYEGLRQVASRQIRRESAGHSLQATALVHETYLRLVDQRQVSWQNRVHFYGVAAAIMRRVLVDHARAQGADKRGGGWQRVTLVEDELPPAESSEVDVLALHNALNQLAAFDPRQERIVELRYFGGLTIDETAEAMGISRATVVREWTIAKAWLRANLSAARD